MKLNYMRLLALFIALAVASMFSSCSSLNDGDGDEVASAFVGSWTLVKATFTGETAQPSDFEGFTITLTSGGTYSLTNPLSFPSPTNIAGEYQASSGFLTFDGGTSVRATSTGNTMVWEWEVSKPGKTTATYRYTFERN